MSHLLKRHAWNSRSASLVPETSIYPHITAPHGSSSTQPVDGFARSSLQFSQYRLQPIYALRVVLPARKRRRSIELFIALLDLLEEILVRSAEIPVHVSSSDCPGIEEVRVIGIDF